MIAERFDCAPGLRLEAQERVVTLQLDALRHRIDQLDQQMQRLERRLWLTVYGVVAVVLTQAVQSLLTI